jgi:anti-sigma factor RsiW
MTNPVCWLIQRRLGAYQDGELGPSARTKTAAHLTRCDACARELETLERLRTELRGVAIPEPPEPVWHAFWPQVRGRLVTGPATGPELDVRPSRPWEWLTSPLAFGSAAAVVAVAVLAVVGPWTPRPKAPPVSIAPSPTAPAVPTSPADPTLPAPGSSPTGLSVSSPVPHVIVQAVETADPNSSVMVFTNEDPGVTVVWVFGLEPTL